MRRMLAIAIGILAAGGMIASGARAQNNPWCAYFSGGPTNCGFTTFGDCLAAIKGKTALCDRNAQYVPPAGSQPVSSSGRHHRSRRDARQQ